MKYKTILLFVGFLSFYHVSFADNLDKIINSANVYFKLTGNETIDNALQNAFRDYWKVTHFVAIPADASKKDITIAGGKAPLLLFINKDEFNNTPGYINCINIVWGDAVLLVKAVLTRMMT